MHHASHNAGGGWCVYDDWMLAVRKLRQASNGRIQKAMMIDLDIHQVHTALPVAHLNQGMVHAMQGHHNLLCIMSQQPEKCYALCAA